MSGVPGQLLAQLAWAAMCGKITALEEAFTGYFTDHHGFLMRRMLARVDGEAEQVNDRRLELTPAAAPG
ncbi:hypothetical protein [Streptomyces sp. NBC_01236]|uniref:hypothetical protein n=1 Tax=Streptomyces sp. NBC_01236 TaxID=2903789 RepID=UPI002E0E4A90|nr:hypothetical protein OG324_38310 [Streptomyces sp. NBC_01236]